MTTDYIYYRNTAATRWDAALVERAAAHAAADAVAEHPLSSTRDQILRMFEVTIDAILALAAPTLGAVADKLRIFWSESLDRDDDYGTDWKQMIVRDIVRIERQQANVAEPDASGGMDMDKVRREWAEALREHDQNVQLLMEGPSEGADAGKRGDLVALIDEAEAKVLSLPAPHLDAVVRKLELLWADDRFDPVFDNTGGHALILRDLRRFALKHRQ